MEKAKLDVHLEALREAEKRIKNVGGPAPASCDSPASPAIDEASLYKDASFAEAWDRIRALALARVEDGIPAALVQQAREAAQPMRRSVAGQIEYWATLGRVVEHTGLTVQEAQAAIEGYEAAARQARLKDTLDGIEARFDAAEANGSLAARLRETVLKASTDGTLQAHIQRIVEDNRQLARPKAVNASITIPGND